MDPAHERDALRRLLDAVDRRERELPGLLAARPHTGAFFGPLAALELQDADVALLLVALAARLDGRPHLCGEELVAAAARSSADRLAALARLDGETPLVTAGLLLADARPEHPADAHDTAWRLADHVFRLACDVFGQPGTPAPPAPKGPYRSNGELLSDLRRLSLHYRRRAARLFALDPWIGTGIETHDAADVLVRRAQQAAAHVSARMAATPDDELFPVLRLKSEHGLDLDSLVVLVTVLYQEVLEGVAVLDAVDLVRLVSESEDDLLRRKGMLRPLERAGLLRLEGAFAGKDLTADASLPNRVVDELIGAQEAIGSDDRIDFHAYLERLDSSDAFFFDLGLDEP